MYKVIKANSINELQTLVNSYLEGGYMLCGGVCVMCNANGVVSYYQAVSK